MQPVHWILHRQPFHGGDNRIDVFATGPDLTTSDPVPITEAGKSDPKLPTTMGNNDHSPTGMKQREL